MHGLENTSTSPLVQYLDLMDPDTNLYYNRETHKYQYYFGPLLEHAAADSGSRTHVKPQLQASPLIVDQRTTAYGEFTTSDVYCPEKTPCIECLHENAETDSIHKDPKYRHDSCNDLSNAVDSKHQDLFSDSVTANSASVPSETSLNNSDNSTLTLDLRLKCNLTALCIVLSTYSSNAQTLASLKQIHITHNLIAYADVEEAAYAHPATTVFNAHSDGSISTFCSFGIGASVSCVCAVQKTLATLLEQ